MLVRKCTGITKKGKPCKKDGVMVTGQCVKHWHMGYMANGGN